MPVSISGVALAGRRRQRASTAGPAAAGTYDDELLDAHYIAGDGRVNENIGLTAVHSIFHSEHNRLVDQTKDTILASQRPGVPQRMAADARSRRMPTTRPDRRLQWNGERLFQVAKFGTEMQYQHLVFEEFARTVQPKVDLFFAPTQVYDADLDPSIVAEFAHTVYRFGHSMLTETVDRFDPTSTSSATRDPTQPDQQIGLIAAFLNPLAFAASGADAGGGDRRHRARRDPPGRQRDRRVRDRGAAQQPARPAARSRRPSTSRAAATPAFRR